MKNKYSIKSTMYVNNLEREVNGPWKPTFEEAAKAFVVMLREKNVSNVSNAFVAERCDKVSAFAKDSQGNYYRMDSRSTRELSKFSFNERTIQSTDQVMSTIVHFTGKNGLPSQVTFGSRPAAESYAKTVKNPRLQDSEAEAPIVEAQKCPEAEGGWKGHRKYAVLSWNPNQTGRPSFVGMRF